MLMGVVHSQYSWLWGLRCLTPSVDPLVSGAGSQGSWLRSRYLRVAIVLVGRTRVPGVLGLMQALWYIYWVLTREAMGLQ